MTNNDLEKVYDRYFGLPALNSFLMHRINSCTALLIFKFHLSSNTSSSQFILICNEILNLNKSIRFVGIANNLGTLLATSYREGLTPLMTEEETKHYAVQAVLRAAIREDFVNRLGNLRHSIGTYDRLIRATVPIIKEENLPTKFFILLSFDIGTDVKGIVENELIPYTHKNIISFA